MLAQDLTFEQLSIVHKQAEGWRTALASFTALLGAVLIVKGRDSVTSLTASYRWTVVALLGLAFALLIMATLSSVRAASGTPCTEILLTGEDLRIWTQAEVRYVGRLIRLAVLFTVTALILLVVSVGVTWLSPTATTNGSLVEVFGSDGRVCGEFVGISDGTLILRTPQLRQEPLNRIASINPVATCTQNGG
jgi:hypothetical protein